MIRQALFFIISCYLTTSVFADSSIYKGGHAKYQFLSPSFSDPSINLEYLNSADIRFNFSKTLDQIKLVSDYQLIAKHANNIALSSTQSTSSFLIGIPDDKNRFFDFTTTFSQDNNTILTHRLDRFYTEISGSNIVTKFGRQSISWGNGLIYTPMDLFNPFDPTLVDKEYKAGDDMLYSQYLFNNGNDIQGVWVVRRDNNRDISGQVDSIALKFHGFSDNLEYDLLLSEHYNETIIGIGGVTDIGEALWRGDITITNAQNKNITSLVSSLFYSWTYSGHNMSGILEYFHNGFGQSNNNYTPIALAANTNLSNRINRGELYTLGKNYLATSINIEMTPLWMLTPNIFVNLDDSSFLTQVLTTYDFEQNSQLTASMSYPVGGSTTEFGSIYSGLNLAAQYSWYF